MGTETEAWTFTTYHSQSSKQGESHAQGGKILSLSPASSSSRVKDGGSQPTVPEMNRALSWVMHTRHQENTGAKRGL